LRAPGPLPILGAVLSLTALTVGAGVAQASDTMRCSKHPTTRNIEFRANGATYGVKVTETACVLERVTNEDRAGRSTAYKAWITTDWQKAGRAAPLKFEHFTVRARLEWGGGSRGGDPDLGRPAVCDIARQINASVGHGYSGRFECATTVYPTAKLRQRYRKGPKSGDGNVTYDIGNGKVTPSWSGLYGSPLV
jgi:hypothetical protein